MTDAIYDWMQNLAYYFIFFSAVMNFIPENTYQKYIRYFMGLLLIMILLTPIFQLFQMEGQATDSFSDYMEQQEEKTKKWEAYANEKEEEYLRKYYENESFLEQKQSEEAKP